jgi:hypothetical protein
MSSALKPRTRALGAGLALGLCMFTATACGAVDDTAEKVTEAAQLTETPKDKLLDSVPTTSTKPFTFTLKGIGYGDPNEPGTVTGRVDATAKAYEFASTYEDKSADVSVKMTFLVVGDKSWVKLLLKSPAVEDLNSAADIPKKWMAIDPAKLKDPDGTPTKYDYDDEDPGGVEILLDAVVDAVEAGGGKYTGTIDLTKATEAEASDEKVRKALGPKAKSVPFAATVGTDGQIANLAVKVPATASTKAYTFDVTYSGYGTAAPVAAPTAAETAEPTDAAYEALNG